MSADLDPEKSPIAEGQPGAALARKVDELRSAWADFQHLEASHFKGADDAKTVGVTVDGRKRIVGLYIEEGLLGLGTETVEQRILEAAENARAAAAQAVAAGREKAWETLGMTPEIIAQVDAVLEKFAAEPGSAQSG